MFVVTLLCTLLIASAKKPDQSFLQQSVITDQGYQYGLDMISELQSYREENNIFKAIAHSSTLQSVGIKYIPLCFIKQLLVETQVKNQVSTPSLFAQHEGFSTRSIVYQYYSEFITKLVLSKDPAKDALVMWKQNAETKDDLLSEFDEGAGYCNMFGDGWICELILVKIK